MSLPVYDYKGNTSLVQLQLVNVGREPLALRSTPWLALSPQSDVAVVGADQTSVLPPQERAKATIKSTATQARDYAYALNAPFAHAQLTLPRSLGAEHQPQQRGLSTAAGPNHREEAVRWDP